MGLQFKSSMRSCFISEKAFVLWSPEKLSWFKGCFSIHCLRYNFTQPLGGPPLALVCQREFLGSWRRAEFLRTLWYCSTLLWPWFWLLYEKQVNHKSFVHLVVLTVSLRSCESFFTVNFHKISSWLETPSYVSVIICTLAFLSVHDWAPYGPPRLPRQT